MENRLVRRVFEARKMGRWKPGKLGVTRKEEMRVAVEKQGYKWGEVKQLMEYGKQWRKILKVVPEIVPL